MFLIVVHSGLETKNTAIGIRYADHVAPSIRKRRWDRLMENTPKEY
jgi:hypothetical protein